jgi:uncharacterized membrane protein YgaE (UPF0421/DUF939 family)
LHNGRATLMPSLAAISAILTISYSFQESLLQHTQCFVSLWMCIGVLDCLHQQHQSGYFETF